MESFLGSYKTKIGDSLKQVESQKAQKERVQKMAKKNEPSHFWLGYKKKL